MGKLADSAFPGIVDVVEQEEERFLIMEWIEGETLAVQMERDGAFAEETVIEIGICLAKAIQKLHQMQPPLLYLDCKPSNVMKDSDGKIRLIDFGSALEAHTPVTKGISASPGYAAPEQLSRETDVWMSGQMCSVWDGHCMRFCAGQTFPDRLMRLRP